MVATLDQPAAPSLSSPTQGQENAPAPSNTSSPSPLSDSGRALLPLFLSLNLDLQALSERTSIPLLDLLDWADSPPIRQKREALATLRQERLAAAEADGRIVAIATLKELAKTSEDPIERRRAAALLMRRGSLLPGSLLPEGGGGRASRPVGAPSSTASTPSTSPSRVTGGLSTAPAPASASSSSASLPPIEFDRSDFLQRAINHPDTLAAYILKTLRAAPRDPSAAASALYNCLTIPLKVQGKENPFRPRFILSGITTHLDHESAISPAETSAPDERGDQSATVRLTFTPQAGATPIPFTMHLLRKRTWPHIDPYWALSDITKDSG